MVRNDLSLTDRDVELESIWVKLRNSKGQKALVEVIYRPPSSNCNVGLSIHQEIRSACDRSNTKIMGNFNLHIDWINQNCYNKMEVN